MVKGINPTRVIYDETITITATPTWMEDALRIRQEGQQKDQDLFNQVLFQEDNMNNRVIGESVDADDVRNALAITIAEAVTEDHEALVLDHDEGATGPMGGTSSRVAGYARVNGKQRSFIVAVYHDNNTDEVCDKLLDKIESRTELEDRLERVRSLLDNQPILDVPAPSDEDE